MNVLNNVSNNTLSTNYNQIQEKRQIQNNQKKDDIFDVFAKKVVNQRDLDDMVTTPRCIFKGYLSFTAGAMLGTISNLVKNDKVSKVTGIVSSALSIYGTYNFVKPYLVKKEKLTNEQK